MCVMRRLCSGVLAAVAAWPLWLAPAAAAESWPSRPIRLVVPFTPGGGTDTLARSLAEGLGAKLGTTVVVENRPGAGSMIGSDVVARSEPDGYTLLIATTAHAINATLIPELPYDTEKDFAAIALVGKAPNVIAVRPDSPLKTLPDMLAKAKAHPGELTYGSSGNGTAVHLAAELLKREASIDITHVPYRGAGPALNDLYGGQIDMLFATATAVAPAVQRGQLRALAITPAQRSPAWPGVPTVAESGLPNYQADVWYAIFAAGGTPGPIVEKLNKAVIATVQSAQFKKRTESEGLASPAMSPTELESYVDEEVERWGHVVRDAGIRGG
ncbi:tripartite tricarboxylate transporter substrate binding protein [Bordetella sp. BOR01]|nr:tripartite tricarboxylate transporter substrate binding protein [Bordetella sp. BOR01]